MHNVRGRLTQASIHTTRAYLPIVRFGALCAIGLASAVFAGCGELEPMLEPEVVDLQLTTETLKTAARDAQRMAAELRADLEARRTELADAQVARAQLEGRLREAERRVVEARQVIELQREELVAARTERERISRSSLQLQSQMKQLQKLLATRGKLGSAREGLEAAPLPSNGTMRKGQKAMQVPAQRNQTPEFRESPQMAATPAAVTQAPDDLVPSSEVERQRGPARRISVKPGDTLWSIAQQHRVNVDHLRAFNQLSDNKILIGQALWLPDVQPTSGIGANKVVSTP